MLDFHLPTFGDKEWVEEVLRSSKHKGCIYSFGQLSLWADKYNTKICRVGDALCGIAGFDDLFYIYPAGIYDIKNIMNIMQEDAQKRGIPLRICAAEDWQWEELDSALPGLFTAQESRNDFDYIYSAKDLAELPGRKYHRKRNHISKFTKAHPNWKRERITAENIAECLEMANKWLEESIKSEDLMLENQIIARALENMNGYGLDGVAIRIDGIIVAIAIGERLNDDIYDIHFEKALKQYAEAYALINREFAAVISEKYTFINREEDLGIEGLRKAKLSYYPTEILKKYLIAEVRE